MSKLKVITNYNFLPWAVQLNAESYKKMRHAKLDLWNYLLNDNR
jgi:hypothetical protein